MARLEAIQVQITLKGGKVLDFLASQGDSLIVSEVDTYTKYNSGRIENHYYNILVTPSREVLRGA